MFRVQTFEEKKKIIIMPRNFARRDSVWRVFFLFAVACAPAKTKRKKGGGKTILVYRNPFAETGQRFFFPKRAMELGLWRGAFEKYRLPVRGALHVGAHDCLEMQLYGAAGLAKCDVLWVEALHTVVERVRARDPKLMLVQGVVSDTDDVDVGFRIASDEVSSSVYEFGSCAHMRPSARVDRVERVRTVTLDTLLARHAGAGARRGRNFLRLDVQGAELAALRGFSAGIAEIDYVVCRVYCAGAYKEGGATPEQVDAHLNASGRTPRSAATHSTCGERRSRICTSVAPCGGRSACTRAAGAPKKRRVACTRTRRLTAIRVRRGRVGSRRESAYS
jgi:FkbM family methyltransferase